MNRDGTIFRASSAAGDHFHPLGCGFNVPDPSSAEANVDPKCENLCNLLAKRIVDRDFKGAHSLLAPWYRSTISPDEIEGMVDAANEGLAHPPHGWTVGEGLAELEELRQPDPYGPPSQSISKEITSSNFRGWFHIQFAPVPAVHEEQNVCYDIWIIAIEDGGAFQIGYLEAAEAT